MLKVCGHRILIKPLELEQVDETYKRAKAVGIELLEGDKNRERNAVDKGHVVSIGTTAFKDFGGAPWCKEGDFIAYAKYAGKWVEDPFDKEKYLVLNDEDVICVFCGSEELE